MIMFQKVNMLVFFTYVQKGQFGRKNKKNQVFAILLSSLAFIFSSQLFFPTHFLGLAGMRRIWYGSHFLIYFLGQFLLTNAFKFIYNNIFLPWVFGLFFYESTYFASPTTNPIGPCQWIMQALKLVSQGPQTPWTLWHFFFGVKRSGSWLVQQPITNFTGTWDDFEVHDVNNPWRIHDHCIMRLLIGWRSQVRPSPLLTRRWKPKRPKGPNKLSCKRSMRGYLHDELWIMFHGLL